MRKPFLFAICVITAICLSSCASTDNLYYWGSRNSKGTYTYDEVAYNYFDKQSAKAICELIVAYEDMVNNPGGTRQIPPPGLCAEYGYLLLSPDIEQTLATAATSRRLKKLSRKDFHQYGLELMQKEIDYYPESAQFIQPLINRAKEK